MSQVFKDKKVSESMNQESQKKNNQTPPVHNCAPELKMYDNVCNMAKCFSLCCYDKGCANGVKLDRIIFKVCST